VKLTETKITKNGAKISKTNLIGIILWPRPGTLRILAFGPNFLGIKTQVGHVSHVIELSL